MWSYSITNHGFLIILRCIAPTSFLIIFLFITFYSTIYCLMAIRYITELADIKA